LWSSATFIINASFEYQMRVAVGIVSGCRRIKETGTENFMSMKKIQQKFMEAIPKERAQGIMSVIFPRLSPESRVLLRNILATEALVEAETLP
jgi:hypothetical protein